MESNAISIDSSLVTSRESQSLSYKGAIWLILIFFMVQLLCGIPLALIGKGDFGMAITLLLSYPIVLFVARRYVGMPDLRFANQKLDFVSLGGAAVFFVATKMAVTLPLEFIPGYEQMVQSYMDIFGALDPATMVIGALIAPLFEEIFFRGMIQRGLMERYGAMKAIWVASLIFGLIHMIPVQIVAATGMGLALGWIYYKTKSLWLPIILHTLNNALAFVMMRGLTDSDSLSMRADIGNDGIVVGIILLSVLIAFMSYRFLNQRWSDGIDHEIA